MSLTLFHDRDKQYGYSESPSATAGTRGPTCGTVAAVPKGADSAGYSAWAIHCNGLPVRAVSDLHHNCCAVLRTF